ncbi:hypothetical protein NA57DRAFT_51739 [Rhizodiscina lignyota]|uniref:C2H2-domain containing protein second zinc finger domain-containing protein n=1 Tax=Rhizodiscina lignyota TaxID=1504668 RepID=A0A9P4MH01_9PEZI|nr:hypothetical protein NA57DRAFT_51739 [Rhizodiscina lignyota]
MPWTIWPALVVLWGVCWMFYNPENQLSESRIGIEEQDIWHDFVNFPVYGDFDTLETTATFPNSIPQDLFEGLSGTGTWQQSMLPLASTGVDSGLPSTISEVPVERHIAVIMPQASLIESQRSEIAINSPDDYGISHENVRVGHSRQHGVYLGKANDYCQHPGQSFAREYDLERHAKAFHRGSRFFCTFANCKYAKGGSTNGFARRDNLNSHVRRIHPQTVDIPAAQSQMPNAATGRSHPIPEASEHSREELPFGLLPSVQPEPLRAETSSKRARGQKRKRSVSSLAADCDNQRFLGNENKRLRQALEEERRKNQRLQEKYDAEKNDHEETRKLLVDELKIKRRM